MFGRCLMHCCGQNRRIERFRVVLFVVAEFSLLCNYALLNLSTRVLNCFHDNYNLRTALLRGYLCFNFLLIAKNDLLRH